MQLLIEEKNMDGGYQHMCSVHLRHVIEERHMDGDISTYVFCAATTCNRRKTYGCSIYVFYAGTMVYVKEERNIPMCSVQVLCVVEEKEISIKGEHNISWGQVFCVAIKEQHNINGGQVFWVAIKGEHNIDEGQVFCVAIKEQYNNNQGQVFCVAILKKIKSWMENKCSVQLLKNNITTINGQVFCVAILKKIKSWMENKCSVQLLKEDQIMNGEQVFCAAIKKTKTWTEDMCSVQLLKENKHGWRTCVLGIYLYQLWWEVETPKHECACEPQ